jgi:hypothetical protein
MNYAIIENGAPREITEQTVILSDRKIPRPNFRLWTNAERAAVNVYAIEDDPVPAGQRATSWSLQFDGTKVRRVPALYTPTAEELAAEADARYEQYLDASDRLQFELHFDMESRVRVLEGKPAITKIQYRAALKARLQALG